MVLGNVENFLHLFVVAAWHLRGEISQPFVRIDDSVQYFADIMDDVEDC